MANSARGLTPHMSSLLQLRFDCPGGNRVLTAAAPITLTRPPQPYPGLRPFEPEEWSIFFGRERMVDDVISRLADNGLVLIHGVSGSGKSSLVRAGVLPKLALQYDRHDAAWLTCAMRPSGGPLWNLAAEFARLEERAGDVERIGEIAGQFNARSATLASVAASLKRVRGNSVCVLVDQFEELFRFEKEIGRDEAELFVDLMAEAGKPAQGEGGSGVDLHVIVTMRSEFLGECARFAGFAETINRTQYLVPRMDDDGLMRAVRRPAQTYGGVFDEALAERLIASVRVDARRTLATRRAGSQRAQRELALAAKLFGDHSTGLDQIDAYREAVRILGRMIDDPAAANYAADQFDLVASLARGFDEKKDWPDAQNAYRVAMKIAMLEYVKDPLSDTAWRDKAEAAERALVRAQVAADTAPADAPP
jgi:hypothetical protein